MKKILILSLFISFKICGQSITLDPSNQGWFDNIVKIKNTGGGFEHRSDDGLTGIGTWVNPNYVYLRTISNNNLSFATNNSGPQMTLMTNGRVGIGLNLIPDGQLDVERGTGTSGTAAFRGTQWISHFNYFTNEDTYIRGGKNGSKVFINDLPGLGSVGIGHSNPNELLDINGRMRIRHNGATSGLWLSNSTNSLNIADGAFFGMENDNKVGINIANAWRFGVNSSGEISTTSMVGVGNRMVLATANGTLFSNSQPQVWSIAAGAFSSETPSSANFIKGANIAYFSSGSSATMFAPVNLPTGVTISEVKAFYQDSGSGSMNIIFREQNLQNDSGGGVSIGTIGTFTSTNVIGIQSATLNLTGGATTIDNANKAYYLEVTSSNWSGLSIRSLKITYSY